MAMMELWVGGTIIYKIKQACADVDDILLMTRKLDYHREMFGTLEDMCQIVDFTNNQKTKYMMLASAYRKLTDDVMFGQYNFESVRIWATSIL